MNLTKFYITTYTNYAHNHAIGILSSNDAQYKYEVLAEEQAYSRFEVLADRKVLEILKDHSDSNHMTPMTLEYGQ